MAVIQVSISLNYLLIWFLCVCVCVFRCVLGSNPCEAFSVSAICKFQWSCRCKFHQWGYHQVSVTKKKVIICAHMSCGLLSCACVHRLSLGGFPWPTTVRCGSVPLSRERVKQQRVYTKQRHEGGAKACVNQRQHCMQQSKHQLGMYSMCAAYTLHAADVGGPSKELIRCVICTGWKKGCLRRMWEICLWPWISHSGGCTPWLLTCGLILVIFLKDKSKAEEDWTLENTQRWLFHI